ncbi:MAG: 16S rRNA (guanine(966)-N(2))-methyltransferase RsmD [Gammaproteobacteria bacterium]
MAKSQRSSASVASGSGTVRIIAGEFRSRKLPVVEVAGLRPTTDRIRETLFNWLQHSIVSAHCLDMFAGTGALGFEAASRGAAKVVMIEQDRNAYSGLQQSIELLKTEKVSVINTNALSWLESGVEGAEQAFDIIFVDPPFDQNLALESLEKLTRSSCVKSGTLIYLEESAKVDSFTLPEKLEIIKQAKAGQVKYSLLKLS